MLKQKIKKLVTDFLQEYNRPESEVNNDVLLGRAAIMAEKILLVLNPQ